jgi:crotonobetainyl-CoA:carnitine CoA-transferase CaiB-like acyl-CoA transferase
MAGRMARHDALDAELTAWCAARPAKEVVDVLWPAGVPVAVNVHPCDQLEFPQLVARDFFEHVEHPVHGDSVHVRFPFRLPGETGRVHRRPAPLLGEHNREVFGDLLGLSDADLAALEAAGVIGTELTT